jgi:hypothetical protein
LCKEKGIADRDRPTICVEVKDHHRTQLIREAGADHVICHENFGLGILAQCALGNAVRQVYEQLLTYSGNGCEVYLLGTSNGIKLANCVGRPFGAIAAQFGGHRSGKNPMTLIGVQRGGKLQLNPRLELTIEATDSLVVLAWVRPRQSDLDSALAAPLAGCD